ncbi:MAG: carbon monoxide dehydrogenase subunit G [Anaerolineales bacterium]|nr:carbon monoxide dehydrogenase subunit G [Anaerolineales bacterium]
MHIEGSYTFQAPREAVWDAIMDPAVMGAALPGGEKLEKTSDTEYEGVMNVRVGPVQGKFQGKVVILEADKPASCTMSVDGRGTPGFLSGTGAWQLAAEGDATVMTYSGDVEVGGKIANVGQRLLDSSAKSLTRQGLEALDAQIQARLAPPAAAEPEFPRVELAEAPLPITDHRSCASVAHQDRFPDNTRRGRRPGLRLHRPEQQKSLVLFILGALSMLVFVVLVRLVQEK